MSDLTYFQSPLISLGNSLVDGGKTLVKRAIIAIEGCHTCNKGKKYEFPATRIQAMADNTNAEIANGRIISMFRNHDKSAESHFGDLTGLVECRRVTADDLPDVNATGMIGKLAIFANANIIKHLDLVKSRSIKALSPGIDTARNIIFEVSAVPVASMPGVALFSYAEVKAQRSKYLELRDRAIESLDTLIESFRQMERYASDGFPVHEGVSRQRTESETQTGGNLSQQQDSFNDFIADLRLIFEVPRSEDDSTEGIVYSQNPYDREVIKGAGFGYALDEQERDDVLDEVVNILKDKAQSPPTKLKSSRRSKGGDFGRNRLALAQGTS